jgi:hypothetical protein
MNSNLISSDEIKIIKNDAIILLESKNNDINNKKNKFNENLIQKDNKKSKIHVD